MVAIFHKNYVLIFLFIYFVFYSNTYRWKEESLPKLSYAVSLG